jgi:hypothetical protein
MYYDSFRWQIHPLSEGTGGGQNGKQTGSEVILNRAPHRLRETTVMYADPCIQCFHHICFGPEPGFGNQSGIKGIRQIRDVSKGFRYVNALRLSAQL